MSPRIIEQKGPASTRVRSSTRIPDSGRSARGTVFPLPHPLGQAAGDRVDAVAGAPGPAPEQARAVQGPQVREVVDVVDGLDGDGGADLEALDVGAVADEARAAVELDDRQVERRLEAWRPWARPVSCQTHSTIWARPVAASGWPRAFRPPEGLMGSRPSRAVSPSSVARPALPGGTRPRSSSEMSSKGVNASWTSATSIRSGPKRAMP